MVQKNGDTCHSVDPDASVVASIVQQTRAPRCAEHPARRPARSISSRGLKSRSAVALRAAGVLATLIIAALPAGGREVDAGSEIERLQLVTIQDLVRASTGSAAGQGERHLGEKLASAEKGSFAARLESGIVEAVASAPVLQFGAPDAPLPHSAPLTAADPTSHQKFSLTREDFLGADATRRSSLSHRDDARLRALSAETAHVDETGVAGLRAVADYHFGELTAAQAGACTVNATGGASLRPISPKGALQASDYTNNKPMVLFSERIPGTPDVLAIVAADALGQLRQAFQDIYGGWYAWYSYCVTQCRTGYVVVRYSTATGAAKWVSGTGFLGRADGRAAEAAWSANVTSLAFHPTCSLDQAAGGTNAGLCPAYARPDMFQREQHVYVADSGNCRIALVDYSDGAVATKWGARGCANSSADFKDEEPVADRVVLGSRLSVAWVGYEFLLVVDGEANRLRKFVTSQHQGLSTLVGNGTCGGADGEGETATLCNPVHAAVTPDLKRLVVAERLDGAGASESFNRLRIVDLAFSYLDGGDLEDVNATVRTLLYEPIEGTYNLFMPKGGMRFTPDGNHLVAGSTWQAVPDLDFDATTCAAPCPAHGLVILSFDDNGTDTLQGELKLVRFADKTLVREAAVTAVQSATIATAPEEEWWNPSADTFTVTIARHSFLRKYEFGTSWLYYDVPQTVFETITIAASTVNGALCWDIVRNAPDTTTPAASRRMLAGTARSGRSSLVDQAVLRAMLEDSSGGGGSAVRSDVVGVVGEAGEVRLVAISVLRSLLSEPIKSDAPLGQ